ncbi:tannase and feruloyl esterase-domain-containing protein [Lentinula guzmanii]|uniref:Carboxylic ester hydrolase n=1 Tax=Lentinula guzmanii TaxID=2804957 RepID=A0AA38JFE1_9AGAR|nr:tannase and feruloyl esterase-domain-containing protein [Lentinula guzmanii]
MFQTGCLLLLILASLFVQQSPKSFMVNHIQKHTTLFVPLVVDKASTLSDWAYSQAVNPFNIDTWKGDLSQFKSRIGKHITWHSDRLISPANSERYYDHVSHTMNIPPSELDDQHRLFRISGLGHCRGGDGAWAIGQTNVLSSMIRWVEEGKAPNTLFGRKYVNGSSRRHCRYPLRNQYHGSGNSSLPESWTCR